MFISPVRIILRTSKQCYSSFLMAQPGCEQPEVAVDAPLHYRGFGLDDF